MKGGTVRRWAMEATQLRVACRKGCDSEIRVSQDEARRLRVGGMKPSIVGQKHGGAEVQNVATGNSFFFFASTAISKTRLIPAATHALRETGHEDESAGMIGAGENDTGQM